MSVPSTSVVRSGGETPREEDVELPETSRRLWNIVACAAAAVLGVHATGAAAPRGGTASTGGAALAVSCQVVLDGGHRRVGGWGGDCRRGLAHGLGAVRFVSESGDGVFAGRAVGGLFVSGVTTLKGGGYTQILQEVAHPPKGMDAAAMASETAFRDAFAGAAQASAAYRRAGNVASARYYAALRLQLIRGQPE